MASNFNTGPIFSSNVLPLVPKIPESAIRPVIFNPTGLNLMRAIGGFNSVIEVSENHSKDVLNEQYSNLTSIEIPLDNDLLSSLKQSGTIFQSDLLNQSYAGITQLLLEGEVTNVEYQNAHEVKITFTFSTSLEVLLPTLSSDFAEEIKGIFIDKGDPAPYAHYSASKKMKKKRAMIAKRKSTSNKIEYRVYQQQELQSFQLTWVTNYNAKVIPQYAIVDVYLDNYAGVFNFAIPSDSDVKLLFDAGLIGELGNGITGEILRRTAVKLVPTVCSVGKANVPRITITEYENFDVQVFPVTNTDIKKTALAIAINVKQGCHGINESVVHFIGDHDTGVISDEFYIDRIFKFKWRNGGFKRSISISKNIEVAKGGKKENAILYGHINLSTLDYFHIEVNSDLRIDEIEVGGVGNSIAEKIILSDGKIIRPGDSDELDFGGNKPVDWLISFTPDLYYTPSPEPEIRAFIEKAFTDAQRHVARPFLNYPSNYELDYVTVNGVAKMFYGIANVDTPFI